MRLSSTTDAPRVRTRRRYALWLSRVGCWLIDATVPAAVICVGYLIGQPTYRVQTDSVNGIGYEVSVSSGLRPAFFASCCIALVFLLWNQGFREGRTGKSIGKRLLGFTTLRESSGEPLGVTFATIRLLLLSVDFGLCYLGVLWPLWDPKRQCLVSDKATGSVVVRD